MNTNLKQQIRVSAEGVDIHAIDGLLWGLPVQLGLAAKQRGRTFPLPKGKARRRASLTCLTASRRWAA